MIDCICKRGNGNRVDEIRAKCHQLHGLFNKKSDNVSVVEYYASEILARKDENVVLLCALSPRLFENTLISKRLIVR